MRSIIIAFALALATTTAGQDTCKVSEGRWSRWSNCQWRLLPCSEISWPEGMPVRDTVEWRWVRERTAPNKASRACGKNYRPGVRRECMDCVPRHLIAR